MCGIFGVICANRETADAQAQLDLTRALAIALLKASETRGREAVGIAIHDGARIEVLKQSGSVTDFLANPKLHELLDDARRRATQSLAITGHSRLATNGAQSNTDNNQPVITHGAVGLHNGIVVNDAALVEQFSIVRSGELDSEILVALLRQKLAVSKDLVAATRETFAVIEGSASISIMFEDLDVMLLATNTGSLFQLTSESGNVIAFASERFILQRVLADTDLSKQLGDCHIAQVHAGTALAIDLKTLERHAFELSPTGGDGSALAPNGHTTQIIDRSSHSDRLQRCTKCILPSTYPFVEFDSNGVCHYCRTWKKIKPKGEQALFDAVEPYRSKDGSPDVIVAYSGGRDSSYGLHYVKKVLGMNPIAYTYDWGMVTDLARRNQARVCGKLGVEHIVRSADITMKRRYVRKNVEAWLKRPALGMVPLFMVGDKEYYQHAREVRKETGIKLLIMCTGNMIEDAPYKTGLMGVREDDHGNTLTGMSLRNKLGMIGYFAKNYALNPSYFNESLLDTANAFYQTFILKDDFLYLFQYLPWREETIVNTIRDEYNWEVATDTASTWRIGDGTAAFYNYIYKTIAGFTEDDAMLANMVREGHLDREEALRRSHEYSKPRWPSVREYANLIGISAEEALQVINSAPKLY
jgi:glucosamine--fructose-6-phosphate aminotransferase (isomerizing)